MEPNRHRAVLGCVAVSGEPTGSAKVRDATPAPSPDPSHQSILFGSASPGAHGNECDDVEELRRTSRRDPTGHKGVTTADPKRLSTKSRRSPVVATLPRRWERT